jgi:hypothetical protein
MSVRIGAGVRLSHLSGAVALVVMIAATAGPTRAACPSGLAPEACDTFQRAIDEARAQGAAEAQAQARDTANRGNLIVIEGGKSETAPVRHSDPGSIDLCPKPQRMTDDGCQ